MIEIDGVLVSKGKAGVYGERVLKGHRVWDPYRSKYAAMYVKGHEVELETEMVVLYLGAANGTTVSHFADYVECVYAVEFAPLPMQDMLMVSDTRRNIIPIMADASRPSFYAPMVEEVDLIYQDVAQPNQAGIFLKNMVFLKEGGTGILMLKTRSVDVTRKPDDILQEAVESISPFAEICDHCWLDPYHRDHAAVICRKLRD